MTTLLTKEKLNEAFTDHYAQTGSHTFGRGDAMITREMLFALAETAAKVEPLARDLASAQNQARERGEDVQRLQARVSMQPEKRDIFGEAFQEFWSALSKEERASYLNKRTRVVISETVQADVRSLVRELIKETVDLDALKARVAQALDKVLVDIAQTTVQNEAGRILRDPHYGLTTKLQAAMRDAMDGAIKSARESIAKRLAGL